MRELKSEELAYVSGGEGVCTPADSGNNYGGITQPANLGQDMVDLYEGAVAFTSHVIERVVLAFD